MSKFFSPSLLFSRWPVAVALLVTCAAHAGDQVPPGAVLRISELERCEVLPKTDSRTRYRCGSETLVAVSNLGEPPDFPARPLFEKPARTHPAAAAFLFDAMKQWATVVVPFSSTSRKDGGTAYYGVVTSARPSGHNAMFYVVDPNSQAATILSFEGQGDGRQAFPFYRDAVLGGEWRR